MEKYDELRQEWDEGYEQGYQAGWEDAKEEIIRCMHLVELSNYQKRG